MAGSSLLNFLVKRNQISSAPFPFDWEGARLVFFQTPEAVETILLAQQSNFIRSGGPPRLTRLLGNGLLRSQGEVHQRQRKLSSQAFVPKQMDSYTAMVRSLTRAHLRAWPRGKVINFHEKLTQLTLEMVGEIFFSLKGAEVRDLGWALQTAIENLEVGPNYFNELKRELLFTAAIHKLDSILNRYIDTKRDADNLLGVLIRARDGENDAGMDRIALRDELVTLLVAGHETTATALSWSAFLLAKDPILSKKIISEGAVYARAVFGESLRLYPPAWILMRRALEPVYVDGYQLKKGEIAILCPYTMGRDPSFFERAGECLPERWLGAAASPEKGLYAFGLGKRRCLGENFAWMQGTEVLKIWAENLALTLRSAEEVTPAPLFTLRPSGGLWLSVD